MAFTRAEKILNRWAADPKVQLSESGKDWLIECLDPFHDSMLKNNDGWPDLSTGSSVVQCIKQSMQISATSGGGAAAVAPWDCHLALLPTLLAPGFQATTLRRSNAFNWDDSASPSGPFGGLMAMANFTSGAPVNWFPNAGVGGTYLGSLGLNAAFSSGTTRVIGIGFEVHDTTADIYRQGTVTVYRQPEPTQPEMVWNGVSTTAAAAEFKNWTFMGSLLRVPPTNAADAMLLCGSRQWAAKDGAYVVGAFHSNQNPPLPTGYNVPVYQASVDEDQMVTTPAGTYNVSSLRVQSPYLSINRVGGGITMDYMSTSPNKVYPYHQCGAIFTGLNPNSSLTVNLNIYVEQFPSVANQTLTVLAKPSCQFDPMALEIYSHALSIMPVGVPVRENGLGTWFANLVSEIEPFVTPIATAFNPALGAVSMGAGVASRAYLNGKKNTVSSQGMQAPPSGNSIQGQGKNKRKKTKKKNSALSSGQRGKKGLIQGPMNRPG